MSIDQHDFIKNLDELCFGKISENIETDLKVTIGVHTYRILLNKVPPK